MDGVTDDGRQSESIGVHAADFTVREGGQARISVVDSGPGIPAGEMARAGERFFRASNVRLPGSGLGLAIVRSIVARFHGRLQIAAATAQGGLRATIHLPLAAAQDAPEAPVEQT